MFSLMLFFAPLADAADTDTVLAALESSSGWSAPSTSSGVSVSTKSIAGLDTPAFRGVRTVDVSCDAYFEAVSDPNLHLQVNSMLRESGVVTQSGDALVFYQVVDLPFISDRYWINKAQNQRDINGMTGHHRQTWYALNRDHYPQLRDAVEDKYDAVFTEVNYGLWDLQPVGANRCAITYSVVSEPGGSIPSGAASWASEKSLPDNINSFYEVAR